MRAHGSTYLEALDIAARSLWEALTGKKISSKKLWYYDKSY